MHWGRWRRRLGIHKYRVAEEGWKARKSSLLHSKCALQKVKRPFTEVSVTLKNSDGETIVQRSHQLGTVCCFPGKETSCFPLHQHSCCFMILTLPQLFVGRLLPDETQMALGPVWAVGCSSWWGHCSAQTALHLPPHCHYIPLPPCLLKLASFCFSPLVVSCQTGCGVLAKWSCLWYLVLKEYMIQEQQVTLGFAAGLPSKT